MKASTNSPNQRPGFFVILSSLFLFFLLSGCFQSFYKVHRPENLTSVSYENLKEKGKYFILHDNSSTDVWHMEILKIENDQLFGKISPLPADRFSYLKTKPFGANHYRHHSKSIVLNEVHIYANIADKTENFVQIPISAKWNSNLRP